jgi:hypothetical protein
LGGVRPEVCDFAGEAGGDDQPEVVAWVDDAGLDSWDGGFGGAGDGGEGATIPVEQFASSLDAGSALDLPFAHQRPHIFGVEEGVTCGHVLHLTQSAHTAQDAYNVITKKRQP